MHNVESACRPGVEHVNVTDDKVVESLDERREGSKPPKHEMGQGGELMGAVSLCPKLP